MQEDAVQNSRKVVPRWRSLARTPTYELISTNRSKVQSRIPASLMTGALFKWSKSKGLHDAAEVVDAALLSGDYVSAVPAAMQVSEDDAAMPGLRIAALQVLRHFHDRPKPILTGPQETSTEDVRNAIRHLKARLVSSPRDAITTLEIARLQSLLGSLDSATKYVRRAIGLAPQNRYVLRSAARFFIHAGEPAEGLDAIWRSDSVRSDPWVQAAEIAVADACNRAPRWATRVGGEVLERNTKNIQFSELAAGLATLEMSSGGRQKYIRKLMKLSLRCPTENSLAQAIWAKRSVGLDFDVVGQLRRVQNAYEAKSRAAYEAEDYQKAAEHCLLWAEDEPFSNVPAQLGALFSSVFLGRYEDALKFCTLGLRAKPGFPMLINSSIVALCYLGRLSEANELLKIFDVYQHNVNLAPYVYAAKGLLAFRSFDIPAGRKFYEMSMSAAQSNSRQDLVLNAMIYWFEQEVILGSSQLSELEQVISMLDTQLAKEPYPRSLQRVWIARKSIISSQLKRLGNRQNVLTPVIEGKSLFDAVQQST